MRPGQIIAVGTSTRAALAIPEATDNGSDRTVRSKSHWSTMRLRAPARMGVPS
jgi:hypothetical protein